MGNIVGNNPNPSVGLQIKVRQGALGASERNSDILNWIASSTPFIRLTSCVSISEGKCKELGIDPTKYSGMGLAKAMVLLGGVWSEDQVGVDGSSPFKAGVRNTNDNKIINNFAYGFGGDDFGLAPPPGIESLDIDYVNRGSIKKSRLKLKVNSIDQLKLIETLYLRMGFNVLIEYGHSVYIDNFANYQTATGLNRAYQMLVGPKSDPLNNYTQYDIQQAIELDKESSCGNYDAFLGRITNFSWGFDDKGAFDVSLEVFSIGDVAESFKMNVPGTDKTITNLKDLPLTDGVNSKIGTYAITAIQALKDKNKQNRETFYGLMYEDGVRKEWDIPQYTLDSFNINNNNPITSLPSLDELKQKIKIGFASGDASSTRYQFECTYLPSILSMPFMPYRSWKDIEKIENQDEKQKASSQYYKDLGSYNGEQFTKKSEYGYLGLKDKNGKGQYYITLRELLRFIEAQCLIYDDATKSPIIRIDTSIDNICYTHPYQLSSNPAVCLIPGTRLTTPVLELLNKNNDAQKKAIAEGRGMYLFRDKSSNEGFPGEDLMGAVLGEQFRNPITVESMVDSPYIGSLLDIWVNLDFVKKLSTKTDAKDPDVTIYSFLSNLMSEIQYSLGNINKFDVTFSTEESIIRITETLPLKDFLDVSNARDKTNDDVIYPSDSDAVTFNIYGFNPTNVSSKGWNNGSFVTSMKFDAKVSNSMRAMVVASSAGGGNNTGIANTAFSRWNKGLTDVLLSKKSPEGEVLLSGEESTDGEGWKETDEKAEYSWLFNSESVLKYINEFKNGSFAAGSYYYFANSNIILGNSDESKNAQKSTAEAFNSFFSRFADFVANFINPPAANPEGYLPLTLSLSFKGLSGLKNYDKIYINQNVLPPNYPKNLGFIIQGVKHKVSSKGWETDIDCMSFGVPKGIKIIDNRNEYFNIKNADFSTYNGEV